MIFGGYSSGMATAPRTVLRLKDLYENLPLPAGHVIGLGVDLLLDRFHPAPLPGSRTLHRASGTGLVLAGVGLNLWALRERRDRTVGSFALERPEGLVTTGPYAITRHPMYVGWWFIRLGTGTLEGSAWVLVTLPALSLAGHPEVLHEEAWLAKHFPESYPAYAERVPRYLELPFPHSRKPRLRVPFPVLSVRLPAGSWEGEIMRGYGSDTAGFKDPAGIVPSVIKG